MSVINQLISGDDKPQAARLLLNLDQLMVYHTCQHANYTAMSSGHLVIIPRIAGPVKRLDKSKVFNLGVVIPEVGGQPIIFHQLNAIVHLFGCHLQFLG